MNRWVILLIAFCLAGCSTSPASIQVATTFTPIPTETVIPPTSTPLPTRTVTVPIPTVTRTAIPTPRPVPAFKHIVILIFENKEFGFVIKNSQMPNYNRLARENTLFTQEFAVTHPSLPNYLALIGGDTFGITKSCEDCFISARTLVDEIEDAGLTWKTYQEDFPRPCFLGSSLTYAQKHNPFIYFDSVRLNKERCDSHIVNLNELPEDLASGSLPNFVFITPNICNSAHDCDQKTADTWLGPWVEQLQAYPGMRDEGLIILTWDEGQGNHGCCGIDPAGGRVATVFISNRVKPGLQDDTPYTHYSILKTISAAFDIPYVGKAALDDYPLITGIWQ
jgi:phosphatidylinositol-3-phosphatase